jgi:serine O-acetyltransferase
VHPIGTVLGRARYEDFLLVYQRCGVGSNHDIYPTLGRHLTLRPGASVLGCGTVADRCTVAAESLVLDTDIPVDSLYIGDPRNHIIRPYGRVPRIWRNR